MPVDHTIIVICIRNLVVHSAAAVQRVDAVVLGDVCVGSVCCQQMKSAAHVRISCGSSVVVAVVLRDREITGDVAGLIHIAELVVLDDCKVSVIIIGIPGIAILSIRRSIICSVDLLILNRNHDSAGLVDQALHLAALKTVRNFNIIAFEGGDVSVGRPYDHIALRILEAVLSVLIIRNDLIRCAGSFIVQAVQRFRSLYRGPGSVVCGYASVRPALNVDIAAICLAVLVDIACQTGSL